MMDTRKEIKNENLLTAEEAAALLRVHVYTIYDLLKSNRLEGFRLKRRWRIKKSSLDKFMSRDQVQGDVK